MSAHEEGSVVGSAPGEPVDSDGSKRVSWVSRFSQSKGNEFFCEVEKEFIQDNFNLTGLSSQIFFYSYALDIIMDVAIPEEELDDHQQNLVKAAARTLYGLIHARYILTSHGMRAMHSKYYRGAFGLCPRVFCHGQKVLPIGLSDKPGCSAVKIFCPKCCDLYCHQSQGRLAWDGAYWGTTFANLFLNTFHYLVPERNNERYIPRIFGFKIHPTAIEVQRNLTGGAPKIGSEDETSH